MNARDLALSFEQPQKINTSPYRPTAYFENIFACEAVQHIYIKRYPEIRKAIKLLEVIYGTDRAQFYRIVDLAMGFLVATDENHFDHWDHISTRNWNASILSDERLPQEFVTIVMECHTNILQSCGRDDDIWNRIFSSTPNSQSFLQAFGKKQWSIDSWTFRELIVPKIVTLIKNENCWANNTVELQQLDGSILTGSALAHKLLEYIWKSLMELPTINTLYSNTRKKTTSIIESANDSSMTSTDRELHRTCDVNIPLIQAGIKELVDIQLNILNKSYGDIYRVLSTQKAKTWQITELGRLGDPNYDCLLSGYTFIATLFFQTLPTDMNKIPSHKKGNISRLCQLFRDRFGLTRKAVESFAMPQLSAVPARV